MSFFTTASALLALSSIASAIPQTGFYANSTSAAGNTTVSPFSNSTSTNTTANSLTENLFCPGLNAQVFSDARGVEYIIECNTNHFGVIIDIAINSTLFSRRQAIAQPSSLGDCLTLCDETSACVGTAFNTAARTCTLFSSVGAAYTDATTDFAVRISAAAGTPVASGASLTSTIFSTNVVVSTFLDKDACLFLDRLLTLLPDCTELCTNCHQLPSQGSCSGHHPGHSH